MLKGSASKLGAFGHVTLVVASEADAGGSTTENSVDPEPGGHHVATKMRLKSLEWAVAIAAMMSFFPSVGRATHEADHRFTVEGFVCGTDGKGSANVDVMVKDTKVSYGQVVKTDGDGYYKATFHLHNDNLGDPLLIEARGEQQEQKVQFDPKDLESERKIQVNFGTSCVRDINSPPVWVYVGVGAGAIALGGFIGAKSLRSRRRQGQKRGASQGKRKK